MQDQKCIVFMTRKRHGTRDLRIPFKSNAKTGGGTVMLLRLITLDSCRWLVTSLYTCFPTDYLLCCTLALFSRCYQDLMQSWRRQPEYTNQCSQSYITHLRPYYQQHLWISALSASDQKYSVNSNAVAIGPVTRHPFPWLLVQQLVTCKAQLTSANQIYMLLVCCCHLSN